MKKILSLLLILALLLALAPAALAADARDDGTLRLVNPTHFVSAEFQPSDLVNYNTNQRLREPAAKALREMLTDMKAAGIKPPTLTSGYRSYSRQQELFSGRLSGRIKGGLSYAEAYKQTARYTAVPGTSEHQLGLAADLSYGSLSDAFGSTAAGKWLKANSWRYGFILRYEAAKEKYTGIANEPWHYRYLGKPHAAIVTQNKWCLEEYFNYLSEKKAIDYYEPAQNVAWEILRTTTPELYQSNVYSVSSDNCGEYIVTIRHSCTLAAQPILVDGRSLQLDACCIDGNNYFRLRDVAGALSGTAAAFAVDWDGTVNIRTGTNAGADNSAASFKAVKVSFPDTVTHVNGRTAALETVQLVAADGGAYTYYKLRDLGQALGFAVDWNQAERQIAIQTY